MNASDTIRASEIRQFARAILHGDSEHELWLMEAAEAFIERVPLPEPRAKVAIAKADDESRRLTWLIEQGDTEGRHGWSVMLRYDNYQDGAQILNADGHVIADCYDLDMQPSEQFRAAIDSKRNLSPDAPSSTGSSVAPPKSESAASAATPKEKR